MADKLAVVITSYSVDRGPHVCDALVSLARQYDPPEEVLFVAEGPQELQSAVEAYAARWRIGGFRCLRNEGTQGLSAARNVATRTATADIIAFLDDDAVAEPGWSAAVRAAFAADETAIGVTGSVHPLWVERPETWLPPELYWLIGCTDFTGWQTRRQVRNAWGVNMAFRRRAFDLAGLFSADAGYTAGAQHQPWGDDIEFSLRARRASGGTIWFEPSMRVRHKVSADRVRPRFAAARARQVGASQRLVRRAYPELAHDRFAQSVGLRIAGMVLRSVAGIPFQPRRSRRRIQIGTIVLVNALLGFLYPETAAEG